MATKRTLEEINADIKCAESDFNQAHRALAVADIKLGNLKRERQELLPKFMPDSNNGQILLWREDCKPVAHYIMGSIVFINSSDSPVGIDLNDIPELISYLERCMKRKTFKEPTA